MSVGDRFAEWMQRHYRPTDPQMDALIRELADRAEHPRRETWTRCKRHDVTVKGDRCPWCEREKRGK